MQSSDSDSRTLTVDEGTGSSDGHCVFVPVPVFRGNYSFYFAKIATTLAFSNSPDFHFSKYVKRQNGQKLHQALLAIKRRYVGVNMFIVFMLRLHDTALSVRVL